MHIYVCFYIYAHIYAYKLVYTQCLLLFHDNLFLFDFALKFILT